MPGEIEITAAPPSAEEVDSETEHKEELVDGDQDGHDIGDSKPKKKRRIIKTSDKKYECPEKDCNKMYSRAEHLYRHQLNPKGSHLQRKDAFLNSQRGESSGSAPPSSPDKLAASHSPVETNHAYRHVAHHSEGYAAPVDQAQHYPRMNDGYTEQGASEVPSAHAQHGVPTALAMDPQLTNGHVQNGYGAINEPYAPPTMMPPASVPDQRRFSFDASNYSSRPIQPSTAQHTGYYQSIATPQNTMQPPPSITSPQAVGGMYGQAYPSPASNNYRTPSYNNLQPLTTPYGYAQPAYTPQQNGGRNGMYASPAMTAADQSSIGSRANSVVYYPDMDVNMQQNIALPVFDDEIALNRSPPLVLNEDFLASLFGPNGIMPDAPMPSPPPLDPPNPAMYNMPLPKLETDQLSREPSMPKLESMSPPILSGLDISLRESAITEKKRMRLIDLVNKRFTDPERMPDWRSREEIMDGSISDPNHVMGMKMLKTFMTSYWVHVHQQMPIMHRPTFNPETCPDLLMIAMMCLGASCIERTHDPELTQRCAEISAFLAYHTRWEVFKDVEFRPTAKLWTFQAMLLLELFEKMYSTRALHERAHIHHATTLTVMRRGSSLVGRSAISESPGNANDPTRTPPGPDGSINTSGVNTQDGRWNRWITAEATRRAAFAAFIIDSTHATLFGHSAVMSPHDIKLPLPCDEALWAATSSAEVQRVEASLAANGFKPTSFVDGLKRTLNGQRVRTNTFGRVILMAGLLNVSWHMNQRDLQVSSLGASGTLGNQMKWRAPLTRAFDFWRRDFDDSLSKNEHWLQVASSGPSSASSSTAGGPASAIETRDSVFESRTCLHSLAHMAMHVDMIDCTVFAGSERALGRVVTEADRAAVTRRMREQWAPSARARDAVFYALRFLCEVLIPDEELVAKRQQQPPQPPTFAYSARDDYLLNRPWVLYFAALIVWSYGYALDGPIRPSNYTLTSRELQVYDMQRYLIRVGGVASPDDLEKLKDRNSCLGLLLLLRQCFREPRWELLHEASDLLGGCIDLLLPGHAPGSLSGENVLRV
ncbi:hypothetical protein B0A48_09179 [Cryoendolithus antarcticus]|uniref:C2H2-type domain-containing protein n=1 Tax=Cryoendolithus antarcticus TaxID=1507870 RepID=A0A1V8T2C6_9PEZI|nr:hypothetical protein B0A48_09179 [Cryoendolithus antarcticus]